MNNFVSLIKRALVLTLVLVTPVMAQNSSDPATLPNLVGVWAGQANMMLPGGITEQTQLWEFTEQDGVFLKGQHSWGIPDKNLKSSDGKKLTYQSTEPFLGVIAHDGSIMLVEHGDHTRFSMRVLNRYTIDFIATEGGENPLVGHGVIVREKL
tara:strand:- start:305 stop:763 length:459 start_codon:yes stop_codon:yes gene_type:complete